MKGVLPYIYEELWKVLSHKCSEILEGKCKSSKLHLIEGLIFLKKVKFGLFFISIKNISALC